MSTIKGTGAGFSFEVELDTVDLDYRIPDLLKHIQQQVPFFCRERQLSGHTIVENQELIERYLLHSTIRGFFSEVPVRKLAKNIQLKFPEPRKPVELPKPQVIIKEVERIVEVPVEVIKYVERPAPPPPRRPTVAEKVKKRIAERAEIVVSAAQAVEELMGRYASEMERDPALKDALTRLLESEKMDVFEQ